MTKHFASTGAYKAILSSRWSCWFAISGFVPEKTILSDILILGQGLSKARLDLMLVGILAPWHDDVRSINWSSWIAELNKISGKLFTDFIKICQLWEWGWVSGAHAILHEGLLGLSSLVDVNNAGIELSTQLVVNVTRTWRLCKGKIFRKILLRTYFVVKKKHK